MNELHRVVAIAVLLPESVNGYDVGMRKPGGRFCLVFESFAPVGDHRHPPRQHFHGNNSLTLKLTCLENDAHSAATDFPPQFAASQLRQRKTMRHAASHGGCFVPESGLFQIFEDGE